MAIERDHTDNDPLERADALAVYRHVFSGGSLDPEVARRVHERAAKVTEEIYRTHGLIDDETFQKMISDDDDEL